MPPASSSGAVASRAVPPLVYRIDPDDCLVYIGGGWSRAAELSGGGVSRAEEYLGRRLWDCFSDPAVVALYQRLVHRARQGKPAQFSYRCDSPTHRRTFLMQITRQAHGTVEFTTTLERESALPPVVIRSPGPGKSIKLTMCSLCQRVELPVRYWLPLEEAVQLSGLLAVDTLPQLVPGLCHQCAGIGGAGVKPVGATD